MIPEMVVFYTHNIRYEWKRKLHLLFHDLAFCEADELCVSVMTR